MKRAGKLLIWVAGGSLLCSEIVAVTPGSNPGAPASSNPYQGIVDRNVFGLKDPPPPPPPPEPPKPPVNITMTGITTLLGKKRVFLTVTVSPKPGAPAVPTSFMLFEGEHQGDITIEQINEKEGTVQLKQGETPLTVSFKENGVKGGPPVAGGSPPPNFQPNPFGGGSTPGQKMIPSRPLRPSGGPGGMGLNTGAANATPEQGINPPGFGGMSPSGAGSTQPQASLAETELMTEAQHEYAKAKGDPTASMFPPTSLNPTRNTEPIPTDTANPGSTGQPQNPLVPVPVPGRPRRGF
jgi:hypothetical protein